MSVQMLLFMLEKCLVDLSIDYSSLWRLLPENMASKYSSVFEALRALRLVMSRKNYNMLVKKVSDHVLNLEDAVVNTSKLLFDPTSVLPEVRKRNVMVSVFSLLGKKAVHGILDRHGLDKQFDSYVARVRIDQPPGFMFPLRMARLLIKDRPGIILFICGDADSIRQVRAANVAGVKIVALPVKTSEVRNIIMLKPDVFLPNLHEVLDLIDLGIV